MKRSLRTWLAVGLVLLGTGCKKEEGVSNEKEAIAKEVVEQLVEAEVVNELGFASKVPEDADFFFGAFYDGEEIGEKILETMLLSGLAEEIEEGGREEAVKGIGEAARYLGTEAFIFSGPGVGEKLGMVGTTYRELSAVWSGVVVGMVLDAMVDGNRKPDFEELGGGIGEDLLARWMDVMAEDSRMIIPSVVVGWHPGESVREDCTEAIGKMLDGFFEGSMTKKEIVFSAYGGEMSGYEVSGAEAFGKAIEEIRKGIEEQAGEMTYPEGLSAEKLEDFLVAMEKVNFTMASGQIDGRVLVYFGDGEEGFRLAENAQESLAARPEMTWVTPEPGQTLIAAGYLSETMVGAVLPWLDGSRQWNAMGDAVRPPLKEQALIRKLLHGLAETSRELAQREFSAWSGAAYSGENWTILTRGGIVNPSIDYDAPLKMLEAVGAMKPAFRGHWVQNRGWNNLSWRRLEFAGFLLEAIGKEVLAVNPAETVDSISWLEETVPKMVNFIHELNRAYRDEFRAGIGDEVAVFGDFLGEVPPIPGVSQEVVSEFTMPRFVYARPVVERDLVSKAGLSSMKTWRELVAYANGPAEGMIPLIEPQSIESGGLTTWYAPLPFIGGDFVPGVTVGDDVWMAGTSRELAGGFAKGLAGESQSREAGVFLEMDFQAMGDWFEKTYAAGKEDAKELAGDEMDEKREELMEETADRFLDGLRKLSRATYRGWVEDGVARSELVIGFSE